MEPAISAACSLLRVNFKGKPDTSTAASSAQEEAPKGVVNPTHWAATSIHPRSSGEAFRPAMFCTRSDSRSAPQRMSTGSTASQTCLGQIISTMREATSRRIRRNRPANGCLPERHPSRDSLRWIARQAERPRGSGSMWRIAATRRLSNSFLRARRMAAKDR